MPLPRNPRQRRVVYLVAGKQWDLGKTLPRNPRQTSRMYLVAQDRPQQRKKATDLRTEESVTKLAAGNQFYPLVEVFDSGLGPAATKPVGKGSTGHIGAVPQYMAYG